MMSTQGLSLTEGRGHHTPVHEHAWRDIVKISYAVSVDRSGEGCGIWANHVIASQLLQSALMCALHWSCARHVSGLPRLIMCLVYIGHVPSVHRSCARFALVLCLVCIGHVSGLHWSCA